ncbi:MAG: ribbon-helix-helix domain-containing protein [Alphaproteobacteria bacterium]
MADTETGPDTSAPETAPKKRSVLVSGHPTSISLEPDFWRVLARLARERGQSLNAFVTEIDRTRRGNLSSAIRLFVLKSLEDALARTEQGEPSEK